MAIAFVQDTARSFAGTHDDKKKFDLYMEATHFDETVANLKAAEHHVFRMRDILLKQSEHVEVIFTSDWVYEMLLTRSAMFGTPAVIKLAFTLLDSCFTHHSTTLMVPGSYKKDCIKLLCRPYIQCRCWHASNYTGGLLCYLIWCMCITKLKQACSANSCAGGVWNSYSLQKAGTAADESSRTQHATLFG